jgi:hypothetical protein
VVAEADRDDAVKGPSPASIGAVGDRASQSADAVKGEERSIIE